MQVNVVSLVVEILLVGLAVVLCGVGALGLAGRLPGNRVLGVRTPETLRDRRVWALANRAAGPAFLGAGLTGALGAIGLALIGGWIGALVVVTAVGVMLVLLNMAGLAGSRAAAQWQADVDDAPAQGCCGGAGSDGAADEVCGVPGDCVVSGGDDPAADCGVAGGCGSCSLNGMCTAEDGSADLGRRADA